MRGVGAINLAVFEVTLGELPLQLRVRPHRVSSVVAVEIDVIVPVAPVGENDITILHGEAVVLVEELVVGQTQYLSCIAAGSVREVDISVLVIARDGFGPYCLAVEPSKTG